MINANSKRQRLLMILAGAAVLLLVLDSAVFTPLTAGTLEVPNRIFMAPLTRQRAKSPGDIPGELQAEHYAQRAKPAPVK